MGYEAVLTEILKKKIKICSSKMLTKEERKEERKEKPF
jgi:hypothetical protein